MGRSVRFILEEVIEVEEKLIAQAKKFRKPANLALQS